jgi:hypothetical protein
MKMDIISTSKKKKKKKSRLGEIFFEGCRGIDILSKSHDRATIVVQQAAQDGDQTVIYLCQKLTRSLISSTVAMSLYPSLFGFQLSLDGVLHFPGQFMQDFRPHEPSDDILHRAKLECGSLTAFFNYNHDHPNEPPSK